MIKHLLSISLIFAGLNTFAQSFSGVYTFSAVASGTASTGYTDPTPVPTATGLTFGSFTAVGTGTNVNTNPGATGRFVFDNWPLGSTVPSGTTTVSTDTYSLMTGDINLNEYYEVTLTPTSGYSISLTTIGFDVRRSGTGIRNYSVRSSADSYAANLPASVGTSTNLSVVGSDIFFWNFDATATSSNQLGSLVTLTGLTPFTNFSSPITFRFYAWNAEGTGGNFSIDNVTINGDASITTGLGKVSFDLNSSFTMYPVPSHDGILFVEAKNTTEFAKIEVLDVLGNIVLTNNSNDSKVKLNMADMSNGNYFVRVYTNSGVATKKITIVK